VGRINGFTEKEGFKSGIKGIVPISVMENYKIISMNVSDINDL